MTEFDERGLMKWEDYYEKYVRPHADRLDGYDVQIIYSVHKRWSKERPYVDMTMVESDVQIEMGGLSNEQFHARVQILENLAILVRMVRLN